MSPETARAGNSLRGSHLIRAGVFVLLGTLGLVAAWATTAPLSGAVIAIGRVKSDGDRRPVQHLEGGIVRAVHVRDGERVEAGALLVELQRSDVAAAAGVFEGQQDSTRARAARLTAERDAASEVVFPEDLLATASRDEPTARLLEAERQAFAAGAASYRSQVELLKAQAVQVDEQVRALESQIAAAERATELAGQELGNQRTLEEGGFVQRSQRMRAERDFEESRVRVAERRAELAVARQRGLDLRLRLRQTALDRTQTAAQNLTVTEAGLRDLKDRVAASGEVMDRLQIRAPMAGVVVDLRVHSAGAVVAPGELLLDLVPDNVPLLVEADVDVQYADKIAVGQPADVFIVGRAARETAPLPGRVDYVSADRIVDSRTGRAAFVVRVQVDVVAARAAGIPFGAPPRAGEAVEVFVRTAERTALDYFMQPLKAQLRRAMREP